MRKAFMTKISPYHWAESGALGIFVSVSSAVTDGFNNAAGYFTPTCLVAASI